MAKPSWSVVGPSLGRGFVVAAAGLWLACHRAPAGPAVATPASERAARAAGAPGGERFARPRGLLVLSPAGLGQRLLVSASTQDRVLVVDVRRGRVEAAVPTGRFPSELVALSDGSALVICRHSPGLGRVAWSPVDGRWHYQVLDAGPVAGLRGVAVDAKSQTVFVASPAEQLLRVGRVDLAQARFVETQRIVVGVGPRAVRLVRLGGRRMVVVLSFLAHEVAVFPLSDDGRVGPRQELLTFEAPVTDLFVAPGPLGERLFLLGHENRAVDRSEVEVQFLDSVLMELPVRAQGGPGQRRTALFSQLFSPLLDRGALREVNLTESRGLAKLDAAVYSPADDWAVIVGSATDNVLLFRPGRERAEEGAAVEVGVAPSAAVVVPSTSGGPPMVVVADRLSDTLSVLELPVGREPSSSAWRATARIALGTVRRHTPAELGEVLFHGRVLFPHNVATGSRSVYACSACHDDAHVDGRLHPAKRNRFRSKTWTNRGVRGTAPYLTMGDVPTLADFSANTIASHAQRPDEEGFDWYPTQPVVDASGLRKVTRSLDPTATREALAAYLATIDVEPNPRTVASGRLSSLARRGLALFGQGCQRCHRLVAAVDQVEPVPADQVEARLVRGELVLTSPLRVDVGTPLLSPTGHNPPSLRGVWETYPYFSDGSARSLREVLDRTNLRAPKVHAADNRGRSDGFTLDEREALVELLGSL
jgi:cytochrome c peroxidase